MDKNGHTAAKTATSRQTAKARKWGTRHEDIDDDDDDATIQPKIVYQQGWKLQQCNKTLEKSSSLTRDNGKPLALLRIDDESTTT